MNLKCKFQVSSVEKTDTCRSLTMSACTTDAGDNKNWSKWTPSGSFQISVTNESTFPTIDAMKYGDIYFLTLEAVPKVETVAEAAKRGFEGK